MPKSAAGPDRTIYVPVNGQAVEVMIPAPELEVVPGVKWGDPWTLFTPAYWLTQAYMSERYREPFADVELSQRIISELGFCILGGFGITAELGTAAYERCLQAGLFQRLEIEETMWADELKRPLLVSNREVKYRYPNQKAKFLASAMSFLRENSLRTESGLELREQLRQIKGVGFKIASWVARNVLDCDDVAILDIHLLRAGRICGLFSSEHRVERDYLEMESLFLEFSRAMAVRPSRLDLLIWEEMREAGTLPQRILEPADQFALPF